MSEVQSCNEDDLNACETMGFLYLRGTGVEKNLKQAKFYLEKACDLGLKKRETASCDQLVNIFTNSEEAVADPDEVVRVKEKLDVYAGVENKHRLEEEMSGKEKECENDGMNALSGCQMLAREYSENSEVKRDLVKAEKYLSYACDLAYVKKHPHLGRNPWAECYYVAEFFHHGEHGIPKNLTKAMKLAEKICDIDFAFTPVEPRGCGEAATLMDQLVGKGSTQALRARQRGCKAGDADACQALP